MKLSIELGGGLELIARGKEKCHNVEVIGAGHGGGEGSAEKLTVRELLPWMREHLITERHELFMKEDSVRPGILVLINECDWELSGCLDSVLEEGDNVIFLSTLHGG